MKRVLFFLVVFLLFTVVAYTMISENIPVVNYQEAQVQLSKFQIKGIPVKDKEIYDIESHSFQFYLLDENNSEFMVNYSGAKPSNFNQANEIVVIGTFDRDKNFVNAERLMVKCPSKYQAEGTDGYEIKEYSATDS